MGGSIVIHSTLALVTDAFRPQVAFNNVASVAAHHRIQCSPGIRDATALIHDYLSGEGLHSELLRYPAKTGVMWWSQASFPEWSCRRAELTIIENGRSERLCSFAESKFSLIQRSAATPPGGLSTKIVLIERAADPAAYAGLDVRGKLVFSRGEVPGIAEVAIGQFGAAGIILDTMRDHPPVRDWFSLPDGRLYLSFWPGDFAAHKALGFVLTPRQGEALRRRFSAGKVEIDAYALVESEYHEGNMEVLTAIIPGETDEEVVGMAHVCHPEPSANDNASGCGALMEVAVTLSRLISDGQLPKPRRTIRFLWLAEMSGSSAYLANNETKIAKTVAAINLDMVGENQDLCGSTFFVEKPVRALPGFGGDLAEAIINLMVKPATTGGRGRPFQPFRWAVCPFSGGSDHNIWGDPTVGVTCPMLEQMPDKFYHTSEDTIDKVDPKMLGVAGVLTAVYLYEAACASPDDAAYLADQMAVRFSGEVETVVSSVVKSLAGDLASASARQQAEIVGKARQAIERRVGFLAERKHADIDSLLRLADDSVRFSKARQAAHDAVTATASPMLDKSLRDLVLVGRYSDIAELPMAWRFDGCESYSAAASIVPKRLHRGPYAVSGKDLPPDYTEKLRLFEAKHGQIYVPSNQVQYWADGRRTLAEIADLIQGETGFYDLDALYDYFFVMVALGVFEAP